MRSAFANTLQQLGSDSRIMLLIADTGQYVFRHFAALYPEQFLNIGIAEANLIGVAAGLAHSGNIPFTYSIASFYSRCFDQIRVDLCYNNMNVKMVGVGSGVAYGTMGPTHHTIEDIAAFRALPNLTIFSPCDPIEAAQLTEVAASLNGPVYLRLALAGESLIYSSQSPIVWDKVNTLRHGEHATIFATGRIITQALKAEELLRQEGISCTVVSVHTLKPVDTEGIRQSVKNTDIVVTVEEHNVLGGLGTIVAEALIGEPIKMVRLGLQDTFCPVYGDMEYVYAALGISAHHIAQTVRKLVQEAS
mgnify:CR=1 FL=1